MSTKKARHLENLVSSTLDTRLRAYFASATVIGAATATNTQAAIVAHTTPQPFGINGEVNIDFDGDGVAEFQIDHDRYNLNGTDLDYLQLDKNDRNSATTPLPINSNATFSSISNVYEPPFADDYDDNHHGSWDSGDLAAWEVDYGMTATATTHTDGNNDGVVSGQDFLVWQRATGVTFSYDQSYQAFCNGCYPLALDAGASIGPLLPSDPFLYDFAETSNYMAMNTHLRANRLIDEDVFTSGPNQGKSRIDTALLGTASAVEEHPDTPQFVGLGGATRYLGVRFDLHDEGYSNNLALLNGTDTNGDTFGDDDPNNYWYGWIGIQITNEADATGVVTGWAYEDQRGVGINAGDIGPLTGITAVPEPSSLVIGAFGGVALLTRFGWQRLLGKKS